MQDSRNKWNERYKKAYVPNQVIDVLELNQHLLSEKGKSLDFACGLGGNALRMADLGYESHAWDISDIALQKLYEFSQERKVKLLTRQCDVYEDSLEAESFDAIIVSRFLSRDLISSLIAALKPRGLIFYQTYIEQSNSELSDGPNNKYYRLQSNELLRLFSALTLRYYREESNIGDVTKGHRNEAMLVAQKE